MRSITNVHQLFVQLKSTNDSSRPVNIQLLAEDFEIEQVAMMTGITGLTSSELLAGFNFAAGILVCIGGKSIEPSLRSMYQNKIGSANDVHSVFTLRSSQSTGLEMGVMRRTQSVLQ